MKSTGHNHYEGKISVGCVNFPSTWGNKKANLANLKEFTQEAAKVGCNLVIFPELALTGYECEEDTMKTGVCQMHRELAETIPGPSTLEMSRLANELSIYIMFGMAERDPSDSTIRYDSVAVIAPEGILGSYRKLHLVGPPQATESICFKPGEAINVFETRYGAIGVLSCYDFWYFPELSRILTLKGARLLINATGSTAGPGKEFFMVQQTGARATENLVFAASANLVGQDRSKSFYGHSTIAGPYQEQRAYIYAQGDNQPGIICAALDFEVLKRHREKFPWREGRRAGLILREFQGLSGGDK